MLNGAMPLMTATVSAVLLRRRPHARQVTGLTVGFAGVVAVMWPALDKGAGASASGIALVMLALVCYGVAANLTVPLQQQYGSIPVIFRVQLGALAMTAPFGLYGLGGSTFTLRSTAAVAVLGAFGTGVAFVAMGTLLGRVGAARGSIAVYFVPVISLIAGVVFRDEHVAALSIAGMFVVIAGAALTSRSEH
jgi:drug/metabolite transporter (DMT)-like permease